MANVDGQIVLGLNVNATAANIQAGLNSILNSTKTKQIIIKTAIEKTEAERSIDALVNKLNKKTAKIGVEINSKDVHSILAEQQKVASTQAKLNSQMQQYRQIAKDIGITLNKDTWNSFNNAIKTENFTKAQSIIKSAKKQIDDYNASVKKMNSDTSISGSVSSIVNKFKSLQTVSTDTQKQITQLKAALTRFENADTEQKKVRAYEALRERIAALSNEYTKLASAEKASIGNMPKTLENIANRSVELKLAVDSSGLSGSGITGLSGKLDELRSKAETLQTKLSNLDPSNGKAVDKLKQEVIALGREFKKAESDAKIFEDVNSISNFTVSIEKAKQKIEEYGQKYSAIKSRPDLVQELERLKASANNISTPSQLKQWNAAFAEFDTKVRQAGVHCKSFGDILKSAFANFAQFFSASRIIYQTIQNIKEMVTAVKELDTAMVSLRKVTDAPEADFAAFFKRSKQSAIDYATTMKDLINSTADFSRLGYTFKESEELAKVASVYNTIGDINNIDKATESIISTFKAFGNEGLEAINIADKFNEVGNNFAISSEGIGYAMKRSASSMAAANNTIDETIALITAANSVVQDADQVGTAFKTISMRIRGAETDLESAGLDTEGMAESTAKLREEIMALSGVDIMIDENNFKSTYQILDELAAKWGELTDIQQASITELIAGKRQGNIVSSLMENFDIARDALQVSLGSSGSAMEEFNIQLESIEAKTNQFKAAFEALSTSVINSNFVKGLLDAGTGLLQFLDGAIEKLGGLGNALTLVATAIAALNFKGTVSLFTSLFNSLKNFGGNVLTGFVSKFDTLRLGFMYLGDGIKGAVAGLKNGTGVIKGFTGALSGVASTASIATAAFTAIVAVIGIAVAAYQNYKREVEEARRATLEETNAIIDNSNQFRSAYVTYMQYANRQNLTAGEEQAFSSAIDQVTKSLGNKAGALGNVTAGTQAYTQALKEASKEQVKEALNAAKQAKKASQDNLYESIWSDWSGSKITIDLSGRTAIDEFVAAYEEVERLMPEFMDDGTYGKELEPVGFDKNKKDYDAVVDYYYKLLELQSNLADAGNMENDIYEDANRITGNLKDTVSDYLAKKYEELSLTYQLNNGIPTTLEEFKAYREYLNSELGEDFQFDNGNNKLSDIIDGYLGSSEQYSKYISQLGNVKEQISAVDKALGDIKSNYQTNNAWGFLDPPGSESWQEAEKQVNEFNNWIDGLSEEDKEIVYNISLTTDTAKWTFDQWNDELQNLKGNTEALDIVKAKVEAIKDVARGTISFDFEAESSGISNIQSAFGESISGIGMTTDAIAKVKARYSELSGFDPNELFEKTANGIHLNADALRELESEYENVNKTYLDTALDEQVEKYNKLTEKINECTDVQERAKLVSEQNELASQIESTATLAAQYDGLTSAYQRWIDAQSGGEEGDMYDNVAEGLENVKKLFNEGLIGTNEFRAAVQLMSNEDLSTASIDELVAAYQSGYKKMQRYFTDGQSGAQNFLNDVSKLNSEWAKMNSDGSWEINFGMGNDQEIADKLGISVESVQAIMRKLSDYGFEINLDSVFDDLGMLEDKFVAANEKLKELGYTDIDFNINSTDINDVTKQIENAKSVLDRFRNSDGTVNINADGAKEAQLLLTALIQKKQQLTTPAVMQVDTTQANNEVESVVKKLQDFQNAQNNLEIAAAIGLDTTAAQTEVNTAVSSIQESAPEILASLGIDSTSAETISSTISALTPEIMVTAGVDETKVTAFKDAEHNADGTVTWNNDTTAVDNWIVQDHRADGTVYWDDNTDSVQTYFTATGTITWSGDGVARGTAFANGKWGTEKSGVALGGELGRELVVRNGKYFTIGDNGAEFFQYEKGDIIFNAEQTEQIFEKGKITSGNRRGRALAQGTAFSSGSGKFYQGGTVVKTKTTTTTTTTKKETYDKPSTYTKSDKPSTYTKSDNTTPQIQTDEKKSSDEESEFERQYKYHQHLLNMDKESLQEYLDWLVVAYKEAYDQNQIETEDYYKYAEEVYEKSKELFDDLINDSEHKIDLWENQGGNEQNIIAEYKTMQEAVHNQAEYYRSLGLDENHENIQELQKQWWDYENAIRDTNAKIYEDIVKNSENAVALNEIWLNSAAANGDYHKVKEYSANIIAEYKTMQEAVHNQAEYYRSLGYSDTSEEVSELSELWWDYQEAIIEAGSSGFQILVDNANNALDDIQGVYDTLKNAAKEYADSGHIAGDTYQEILSMGVEYLAMLRNENGELVINERTIKKVIKAKTNQLGIETALNYIQSLRTALTNNDTQALNNLLTATDDTTRSTWGLVYAQLAMLDLSDEQYKNAFERINMIRSLTETAIDGVGKPTDSLIEGLNETSEALQSILDYVIEVIRQETENKIENLEEQISDYKEIVDLQKESLQTTKDQNDYNKNVTDKLKEIAEIQNRINQLSLDDSREAQAEKKSLEEELAELQGDLADTQADYAYDKQVESLDKMAEAYEEAKNDEIELERDKISSYQKLYDLAIDRIEEEGSGLLSTLLTWNEQYGNDLNETIETAWGNACDALDTYNYKLEKAMSATKKAIENSDNLDNTSLGGYSSSTDVRAIRKQMKANSLKWYTVDEDTQDDLAEANASYASQLGLTPKDGSWYSGNEKFYSIGTWEAVDYIVKAMRNNSSNWTEGRTDLESANERMASYIESLSGQKVWKDGNGVWWIGNDKLYDSYGTYHTGGIVGGNATIKDNEVLSLLEKGEVVLDEEKKKNLYRILDDSHPWLSLAQKMSGVIVENNANSVAGKFKDMMNKDIANTLSQVSSDNSTDIRIDKVEVHAPIQVTEKLDKSDIKKHSKLIGEVSAGYIKEGFTKRGIKPTAQLF